MKNRVQVTHDTDIYYFELPRSTYMQVPLGYHVFLKPTSDSSSQDNSDQNLELFAKPYTVVTDSLSNEIATNGSNKTICLMIKHYMNNGMLTPKLKDLKIGSKILMSNYTGTFRSELLHECNELFLICAGSGITPMLKLIAASLKIDSIM